LRSIALRAMASSASPATEIDTLHLEQSLILLDQGILRLKQDALERRLIEIFERGEHWQAPNEFAIQAI
jgi:hypothetical protein